MGRARRGWSRGDRPRRGARRRVLLAGLAVVIPLVAAAALVIYTPLGEPLRDLNDGGSATAPRAVIVDQLSLTAPNPSFAATARSLLEQAGYSVDYYPGEEVTVDFYRDLPTQDYDLLVLRVHSALTKLGDKETDDVSLFTNETYNETKYLDEQATQRLSVGAYYSGWPGEYFAVTPVFVRSSMKGEFDDATIILMGCYGLTSDMMAEALVRKGAKSVVSWDGLVTAPHTDAATEHLLRHLLLDGLTVEEATAQSMAEVGPDPQNDSRLLVYPSGG
jgi:hypothetical protein